MEKSNFVVSIPFKHVAIRIKKSTPFILFMEDDKDDTNNQIIDTANELCLEYKKALCLSTSWKKYFKYHKSDEGIRKHNAFLFQGTGPFINIYPANKDNLRPCFNWLHVEISNFRYLYSSHTQTINRALNHREAYTNTNFMANRAANIPQHDENNSNSGNDAIRHSLRSENQSLGGGPENILHAQPTPDTSSSTYSPAVENQQQIPGLNTRQLLPINSSEPSRKKKRSSYRITPRCPKSIPYSTSILQQPHFYNPPQGYTQNRGTQYKDLHTQQFLQLGNTQQYPQHTQLEKSVTQIRPKRRAKATVSRPAPDTVPEERIVMSSSSSETNKRPQSLPENLKDAYEYTSDDSMACDNAVSKKRSSNEPRSNTPSNQGRTQSVTTQSQLPQRRAPSPSRSPRREILQTQFQMYSGFEFGTYQQQQQQQYTYVSSFYQPQTHLSDNIYNSPLYPGFQFSQYTPRTFTHRISQSSVSETQTHPSHTQPSSTSSRVSIIVEPVPHSAHQAVRNSSHTKIPSPEAITLPAVTRSAERVMPSQSPRSVTPRPRSVSPAGSSSATVAITTTSSTAGVTSNTGQDIACSSVCPKRKAWRAFMASKSAQNQPFTPRTIVNQVQTPPAIAPVTQNVRHINPRQPPNRGNTMCGRGNQRQQN